MRKRRNLRRVRRVENTICRYNVYTSLLHVVLIANLRKITQQNKYKKKAAQKESKCKLSEEVQEK